MSIATHTPATTTAKAPVKPLITAGLIATAIAAAATAATAALGDIAGISLEISGKPIPASGFAILTAIFSVVGLALALLLARMAHHPRTAFIRTTLTLTALSLVPDILADAAPATKALFMLTHLVAAAIVIPTITRRLPT